MESEVTKIGDYYIEIDSGKLKITLVDSRHRNISIVPSSGNSIIIKPEDAGGTQFKTK